MYHKSQLLSNKKGFLQIDFAFAILIFISVFFIFYQFYDSYNINSQKDLTSNILLSDSIDICNLLISTPGYPQNWEDNISSVVFIGMKNITSNTLSTQKVANFTSSNYIQLIDTLKFNDTKYVNIKIIGVNNNTNYLDFGNFPAVRDFASYTCYSNYNGELVKIQVEVWK